MSTQVSTGYGGQICQTVKETIKETNRIILCYINYKVRTGILKKSRSGMYIGDVFGATLRMVLVASSSLKGEKMSGTSGLAYVGIVFDVLIRKRNTNGLRALELTMEIRASNEGGSEMIGS